MPQKAIPNYAKTIIVPLANPATAPYLLQLAAALVHPEKGRVVALVVSLGDPEAEARALKELEPIVNAQQASGANIEFVSVVATSAARGILDTVREMRADLLIIGVRQPSKGQVELGTVAENVALAAPCDVLIYRAAQKPSFERVVVWANGSQAAQIACQIGILLSNHQDVSVEGMYVQRSGRPYWQALARIEQSLEEIPGANRVKRTVIKAGDLVAGLLSRVNEEDLLIVGFARHSELEKWLFGDFVQQILNNTQGPVILSARAAIKNNMQRDFRYLLSWIRPTLTRVEQQEIERQAQELGAPNLDYVVLIIISALLATFGLLLDSAAVIIGAMLVAPLMQPISAFSVGLTTGQLPLMRRAILTLVVGVLTALAASFVVGSLVLVETPTREMLSRGSPSLLDAGVALASGFVGAYAIARKDIPAALAGVAIAAALMPPVCTVGLAVAFGETDLAMGSLLLFLVNIAYIGFAAWVVFFWLGLRPRDQERSKLGLFVSSLMVVVVILAVFLGLRGLRNQASDTLTIEHHLEELFAPAEVVAIDLDQQRGGTLGIIATLRAQNPPSRWHIQRAEEVLETTMSQDVELSIIVHQLLMP